MRLGEAVLVLVDISGYTQFITQREVSLLHAEEIINELLESLIDRTEHPLLVNKLEGDAIFMYAEARGDLCAAITDALLQLRVLFQAFEQQQAIISNNRSHCQCDACANVQSLRLKAFMHCGEIAIRKIRQFEELAGEHVILVHRLMKNGLNEREYILASSAVSELWPLPSGVGRLHVETFDGMGELNLMWVKPKDLAGVA